MASLLHPFTNLVTLRQTGPLVLERGKGVFVYGLDGKDYLEAMGGLWCTALGWGENELAETGHSFTLSGRRLPVPARGTPGSTSSRTSRR